jgi:solute carrier family 25 (mitochondrial aspartate/glutamate transporter), member 12/13
LGVINQYATIAQFSSVSWSNTQHTKHSSINTSTSPIMTSTAPSKPVVTSPAVPFYRQIIYSGLSGAIATTCIYTIDLTKTKLQDDKAVGAARRYKGPWDCFKKIYRADGIRGLYRGWPPNVLLVMPEKAIKLTLNDYFRRTFKERNGGKLTLPYEMLSGGLAGMCQVTATNPMELLKIQGATMRDKLAAGEIKKTIGYRQLASNLGITGLYTGVLATLVRDVPFSVVYFTLYGQIKDAMTRDSSEHLGPKALLSGAIAGTIAAGLSTPLDVVKTRVHSAARPTRMTGSPLSVLAQFSRTEMQLLRTNYRTIIQNEGHSALFKGVAPRCAIMAPLFAITMVCYETFKEYLG